MGVRHGADGVGCGVEVDPELRAVQRGSERDVHGRRPRRHVLGGGDRRLGVHAVDDAVGAHAVEVTGLGAEVDSHQRHAGRQAAGVADREELIRLAHVEADQLVLIGRDVRRQAVGLEIGVAVALWRGRGAGAEGEGAAERQGGARCRRVVVLTRSSLGVGE
jgi:hypothetical protein